MNNRKKFIFTIIMVVLADVALLPGFTRLKNMGGFTLSEKKVIPASNDKIESVKTEPDQEVVKTSIEKRIKSSVSEKLDKTVLGLRKNDLTQLKNKLEVLCKNNGEWSIYIKDLKTGEQLSINNKKMVAASVIKLFIMAKVYEDIEKGKLAETDYVKRLLKKMITLSHNDSSNKLVELLGQGSCEKGMALVNDYAKKINCLDTMQQRRFYDNGPPPNAKENYTSVEDCGRLLEKIYNKQCVGNRFDEEMMNLLLSQERNSKLPELLPKNVRAAHKTGELSEAEHDVGIIFTPRTDYIICVMSNHLKNTEQGRAAIGKISKAVYDYLENQQPGTVRFTYTSMITKLRNEI